MRIKYGRENETCVSKIFSIWVGVESKYLSVCLTAYNYRLMIRWESFPSWMIFNKDCQFVVRERSGKKLERDT